jgi:zinc transporter ZupT
MEQLIAVLPQLAIGIGTAVGTVIGVLRTNGSKMDRMTDGLAALSRDIDRLTLHDEHLAITERLAAGERYVKSGGNGAALAYYEKLLTEYKEGLVL